MNTFIFRNMTIERFFPGKEYSFSGYGDISFIDEQAESYIWFYLAPIKTSHDIVAAEIDGYLSSLQYVLSHTAPEKQMIAFTMIPLFDMETVICDRVLSDAIQKYNASLYELSKTFPNLKVLDFSRFLLQYPQSEWFDWKYYFISQMAINPKLAIPFQEWFTRQLNALAMKRKKCLVLDMDNTLWGGVLGEDGIEGIALGGDYPGKAYRAFQSYIVELERQGVILAACSKNNLSDVQHLWQNHPDNLLTDKNFAAYKINWDNKSTNIQQLAAELNIGLDSFVFIDDNPTERDLIRTTLPDVTVPDFPAQPYMLPTFIKKIAEKYFQIYSLTKEDLSKTEQYKANAQRNSLKAQFVDMDEYIRNLEITLQIQEITDITLARVAQMSQKTNQFNLTTHRYTESDIRSFITRGAKIYTLSVCDKYGDSGITGACIVKVDGQSATIDTFLLSCRILGKRIECEFLKFVLAELVKMDVKKVSASYIPSAKNIQVADFYDRNGFVCESLSNGEKHYTYILSSNNIELSTNYTFVK